MTDVHPMSRLLQEGKMIGLDLREHMGVVMFLPTQINPPAAERGEGRIGTLPSMPKPKPVHGGYPEPSSHKLDPGEYQPVSFPDQVRLARAEKKSNPFSIVRN